MKKSTIELHVKSVKHIKGKEQLIRKEKRHLDIVASLREYDKDIHPSGETLPDSTHVYRVNVVTALLKAGIPLTLSMPQIHVSSKRSRNLCTTY